MKNHIGRIVLLVKNYDEAADFYQRNFGFTKLFDMTTPEGQRFLHVGTEAKNAMGIWFLLATESEHEHESGVGKQTQGEPLMVIYTSAIMELYKRLKANGVKIKVELVHSLSYSYFHCFDLYGNEIVVVEHK